MRRILAALALLVLLTGCVRIPDSGPVREGAVDASDDSGDLIFLAEEPAPGATQEEIVLGFLGAAVSPHDDFAIARQYLAEDAARDWEPGAGVLVRSGQPQVALGADDAATAVVTTVSSVDAVGALGIDTGEHELAISLAQVDGEWRIVEAPDGIVLSSYHFAQLFRAHTLEWLSPDRTRLVPEVRWFERTAATLPGRIVDALLAGPSAWLEPAVETAAAPSARLEAEPVIEGTTASVVLSASQVVDEGNTGVHLLAAQIARSLRELGVREVQLQFEGLDGFDVSSADAPPLDDGAVDQRPLVLEGSTLRLVGAGASVADDVGPQLSELGATGFTVGAEGGVAMTGTSAMWIATGGEPRAISGDVATMPTVDDSGWVLLQERSAAQRLLGWHDGERVEVPLPTGTAALSAMELARDGARLAYAAADGGGSAVWVAAVVRDADGTPRSLGEPVRLPLVDGEIVDLTWTSPTELAVLALAGDQPQIVSLTIGGGAEQLPQPSAQLRAIVGGSEGTSTLRALGTNGELLALRGSVWSTATGLGAVGLVATQQ